LTTPQQKRGVPSEYLVEWVQRYPGSLPPAHCRALASSPDGDAWGAIAAVPRHFEPGHVASRPRPPLALVLSGHTASLTPY